MKQIIPFKKELLFKTKVSEITSISLEHTLNLKSDDIISGQFQITGDYKMTEGSINREKFNFELPFDIALDSRYDMDSIVIDIDNFYYEIVNNESLQVNIDVYVEGEKIKEEVKEEVKEEPIIEKEEVRKGVEEEATIEEDPIYEEVPIIKEEEIRDIKNAYEYEPSVELDKPNKVIIEPNIEVNNKNINNEFNIFDNIDNADTYVTYYVYIVKENDTIDKILDSYSVTKEELSHYNDLENIIPGSKLIIPSKIDE